MLLKEFEPIFRNDIAPIYINNEKTSDPFSIHGCLHISRSLIICRALAKKILSYGNELDIDKISYAVSFHDSARGGSGIDFWEKASSEICYEYLNSKGIGEARSISDLIIKRSSSADYNYLCVYDTDVLEIMRPCTGIGVYNFNKSYLRLNHLFHDYDNFINEIIPFILETENEKSSYSDKDCLSKLIDYIDINKGKYPTIYDATIS